MAWYKTGTVQILNGGTTVTGTGTSWVAGAGIGEAISLPDDRLYEIANISSDSSLTLASPYLGTNVSGQTYTIVPTQSYIRQLAADASSLINTYGSVLTGAGSGKFQDGTVSLPGIAFSSDVDTGIRRSSVNVVSLVAGGADILSASTGGVTVATTLVTPSVTTVGGGAVQFPNGLNATTVTATNATIGNLITGNLTTPQGGPIEIGKYVDFHSSNSIDYNARIEVLDGSVVGGSAFNLYAGSFNSSGPITAPSLVLSSGLSFGFSMTTFTTGLKLKVANLPLSDDSTRDILRIEGVAGPWIADAVSFGITIQNRSGPRVNVDYGYTFGCSFELWTEVDGTVSVWATLPNGFFNMQFNVVSSSNCTIYPQGVGGTPTGTLLYATPVCTVNSNTSAGAYALRSNTTGAVNTSFGLHALYSNTTGSNNTGVGKGALEYNTTGYHNTGVGVNSLRDNTTGYYNTGVGLNALVSNTTGYYNTGIGISALASTTTGSLNVGIGVDALGSNSTGTSNAAIGVNAMQNSTSAGGCVAVGKDALRYVTTGNYNIAVGHAAGSGITSGISNISIGGLASNDSYTPAFNITTQSDYASFGSTSLTNAYIQVAWTTTSDVRYKTDFAEVPHGLDFLTKVTPTAFRYKQSKDATEGVGDLRYGFKAQEILALEGENPVIIDVNDPDTLRFKEQSMLAVMVNAIKELKVELDNLKSDFDLYKSTHP